MSDDARLDPIGIVVGSLCTDGPILGAFGISTSSISRASAGHLAWSWLKLLRGDAPASTDVHPQFAVVAADLERLARPTQTELREISLDSLARWIFSQSGSPTPDEVAERFWEAFAPESAGLLDSWDQRVAQHRTSRIVDTDGYGHTNNGIHILLSSNVLLTSDDATDKQRWFYDHPTSIGADTGSGEVVHGLRGLDEAIAFEKRRGVLDPLITVDCVLSVSVTHEGLLASAVDEVRRSVNAAGDLSNLAVFAFSESATEQLIAHVLAPAVGCEPADLAVFGVNGNYGRHYSFGKAIAALWQTVMDPGIDRTFKIDLDQVFPQERLVAETGMSALELLSMPRWGSVGTDGTGRTVELGMCAGAVVNEEDIHAGLFTPDVTRPVTPPGLADLMFRKAVPQALSTEAEMMDRGDSPPGVVRQRVHVTGGTTGITIDALTRFRPFTPSFISRAEDQAYLLSVMGRPEPRLRTVHMPGLFMRHDKGSVAGSAVGSAEIDTAVGDYERTILFTGYARALGLTDTQWLGPFTGSYISEAPLAVTLIRLMLEVIDRSLRGDGHGASDLLVKGVQRVAAAYELALAPGNRLAEIVDCERVGWDRYYDAVEALDGRRDLVNRARGIIETTRLR